MYKNRNEYSLFPRMSKKYRRWQVENQSVNQADTHAHALGTEIGNRKGESEETNYEETFMRLV